jgi:two-component system, chemotaxis family, chemotaxis protein CheY
VLIAITPINRLAATWRSPAGRTIRALRRLREVVITDLNMPNMDGVGLIRSLRSDPKWRTVPILMLTTESDSTKKTEGKNAGATGWIVKPFDPEKLVQVVNRVCG